MDAKKILLLTMLVFLAGGTFSFAGDTTITGTSSCYMPVLIEMQPAAQTLNKQDTVPPVVSGASGQYIVQKEEKLIQTEETLGDEVTVYTVSAK